MLKVENLSFGYKKNQRKIFENLFIEFTKGFNVVLGPNGAGKSTLLKVIFGLLSFEGEIFYRNRDLSKMNIEEKIELMSYLPQMDLEMSNLTVLEMVLLGRLPDLNSKISDKDLSIVMETLVSLNIYDLASRNFTQLSGGQKKLVFIAQTLVRYPNLILLDEPTNSLDLQKQLELCFLLKKISIEKEIDLIIVLHDINLAIRFADNVIIMDPKGKIYSMGDAREVINTKMLEEVYGVKSSISYDEEGRPVVIPKSSIRI